MLWLDDYERRARLIPGLWLIAPAVVLVLMFGLRANALLSTAGGLLSAAGGPVVLAAFVRHRGLSVEPGLLKEWSGWPTTQLLLTGSAPIRDRRREAIQRLTGINLPAVEAGADATYDAAVAALRSQTRDRSRFDLVFAENRNYGYERNLIGVRPIGLAFALTAVVVGTGGSYVAARGDGVFTADLAIGLIVLALLAVFWLVAPSRERARVVAFKYAERLLDAAISLSP
jgi:hypothetical protein